MLTALRSLAAVDKAVAYLASKRAQLDKSEIEYQRNLRLIKENAASQRDLDNGRASRDSAKADVAMAEASLQTARINLSYTTIYAPISGRIGRSQVDVGNLVGAGEFTLLTTIKQYDPIYAYFSLNERDLLALRAQLVGHLKGNHPPKTKSSQEVGSFRLDVPDLAKISSCHRRYRLGQIPGF